jgi:hypothetical protein
MNGGSQFNQRLRRLPRAGGGCGGHINFYQQINGKFYALNNSANQQQLVRGLSRPAIENEKWE